MKNIDNNLTELSHEELKNINGGSLMLLICLICFGIGMAAGYSAVAGE